MLKVNGSSNVRGVRDDEADGCGEEENANKPKDIARLASKVNDVETLAKSVDESERCGCKHKSCRVREHHDPTGSV